MSAILIPSLTDKEAATVNDLLRKHNIAASLLSDEQVDAFEDFALGKMMEEANVQDLVLREDIMQKLNNE